MIKANDQIKIRPEYQDDGDESIIWIALEDEDGGRVRIAPVNTGLSLLPCQIVTTAMIEKVLKTT